MLTDAGLWCLRVPVNNEGDDEMRTDERTGQAAKHALKSLQDKVQRERMMSRDGNFLFMSQDERQKTAIQIDILKQVCGIEWKEG